MVILSTPSFWSFIFFHDSIQVTWKMIKDEDDDHQSSLNIVAKYINGDCLNNIFDHRINGTKISEWLTDESMSDTQKQLLEKLAMSSDFLPNLLICNTITSAVNKHDSAPCCTECSSSQKEDHTAHAWPHCHCLGNRDWSTICDRSFLVLMT